MKASSPLNFDLRESIHYRFKSEQKLGDHMRKNQGIFVKWTSILLTYFFIDTTGELIDQEFKKISFIRPIPKGYLPFAQLIEERLETKNLL